MNTPFDTLIRAYFNHGESLFRLTYGSRSRGDRYGF